MRVRFSDSYDYTPSEEARVLISFSPTGGQNKDGVYTVRRECGEAAVAAGKAEALDETDPAKAGHDGDKKAGAVKKGAWRLSRKADKADAEA